MVNTSLLIDESFSLICRQFADKTALSYLGTNYSYARLERMVSQMAASLHQMDIKKEDRVILYLPNMPQWIIAFFALQRIGAVAVPITPFYTPHDLSYIANDCGAETVFCLDTNFGYVIRVQEQTQIKRIIVTTMGDLLPTWKQIVARMLDRVPHGRFKTGDQIYTFRSLLKVNTSTPPVEHQPENIAEILYTGGTLGYPKGVAISQGLFMQSATEQRKAREVLIPLHEDTVIQGGGLYHILGQAVGLGSLLFGDTVVLLARINLDAMFDHIARLKATTFFGVPAMYRMILEHDRLDQYDLSSLRYCFSGGDVLPSDVAQRWEEHFGQPIYQGYGATETCGGISLTPAGEPFPPGTAGQIVPFQQVMVVDPQTLEELPPDEPGELLVSSERMVSSYLNKPEETALCFVEISDQLWYRTGDIVRIDHDGWLFFIDRTADTIKHKGYRVAASKIETVLQGHPAVIASCVIGVPDQDVGERIKAFVVLKDNVRGVTAYDLLSLCRTELASYEIPHYIEIRDMLPKSKVGKLLRRDLRADERRKLEVKKDGTTNMGNN